MKPLNMLKAYEARLEELIIGAAQFPIEEVEAFEHAHEKQRRMVRTSN
jgi:hypothetical protein